MFDKNTFKDAFRSWVQNNPTATEEDALGFCQSQIPAKMFEQHCWLVEQSLQWFTWLKKNHTFDDDFSEEDTNHSAAGRILC